MPRAKRFHKTFGDIASQLICFAPRPCGDFMARKRSHCFARRIWRHRVAQSFCKAKTLGTSFALCRVRAAILWYGNTRIASPGVFGDIVSLRVFAKQKLSGLHSLCAASVRRSRARERSHCFARRISDLQKLFHRFTWRVFGSQKYFHRFPEAFSDCKSIFVASPVCFRTAKVLSSLARRVFGSQKYFHRFTWCVSDLQKFFRRLPGAFPARKSIFIASPKRFRTAKVLSLLPLVCFRLAKVLSSLPRCISDLQKFFRCLPGALGDIVPQFTRFAPRPCGGFTDSF